MNTYDFVQIAKFLNRKNIELESRINDFESRHHIFRKFDELDVVDLHKLICNREFLNEFEVELLKLCDYLIKYNN